MSPIGRISHHKNNRLWFNEVATITITRFEGLSECRAAEKDAIRRESPQYNKREIESEVDKKVRINQQRTLKRNLAKFSAERKPK